MHMELMAKNDDGGSHVIDLCSSFFFLFSPLN